MRWKKMGMIFEPSGQFDWVKTHAMLPIPELRSGDIYRIYFSGRDSENRSLVGYIEIDLKEPKKILRLTEKPILGLGQLGCHDDSGVTPSWIVDHNDKKYMYYVGWNKRSSVRMGEMPGLAISADGGESFKRVSRAPLFDRTDLEPFSILAAPCVLLEGRTWKMWYVSGVEWVHADFIRYNIKYAESEDGIHWKREGVTCIDFETPEEHAFARPCVLKEDGIYKMWYAYKRGSGTYRLGYAESKDGMKWSRLDDQAGIDVSASGWDSEMIEYPYVFNHKGAKYMLYNGNGYGKNGFGYAVLEQ